MNDSISSAPFSDYYNPNDFDIQNGVLVKYTSRNPDVVIPSCVTQIADNAFEGTPVQSLVIPESVTTVQQYALHGCSDLKRLEIYGGAIDKDFFKWNDGIESLYIGEKVKVSDGALEPLISLRTLGLDRLGDGTGKIKLQDYFGKLKLDSLDTVYIANGVIGFEAFKGIEILAVVLGVVSIGNSAFADCLRLKFAYLSSAIQSVGNFVFDGCKNLEIYCGAPALGIDWDENWNNLNRPVKWNYEWENTSNVESSQKDSQYNGDIRAVLKSKYTSLVFYGGEKYYNNEIEIPSGTVIIAPMALRGNHFVESITIPDSVLHIGSGAFWGCLMLESITLPNGLTEITSNSFCDCKSLKNVVLPNSVKLIREDAFHGCSALKKIKLPPDLNTIEQRAFDSCTALKKIVLPAGIKTIGEYAFGGCYEVIKKVVNSRVIDKYRDMIIVFKGSKKQCEQFFNPNHWIYFNKFLSFFTRRKYIKFRH